MAESYKEQRKRKRKSKGPRREGHRRHEPRWKVEAREIEEVTALYENLGDVEIARFNDIPLSKNTREGLKRSGYSQPTKIQKEAIPLALKGRDVLGAAKTGSGKTLAFLVPVLELLWRERWTSEEGMGALIISPTRELAYQTFEVLRKIGCCHDFSAGLVIGGKDVEVEKKRIQHMNILICTPGRLLQHMDQTVNFDCSSLKVLVLDEADRILDLGFQKTMNAIIENLPSERQTLLFSATQTKSVRDLARLSLSHPEYVAVHEHSKSSTPHKLSQSYITCDLPDKLSVLYSFIRSHVTSKSIVFLSSCKQVKYTYEAFCRLRPGVPLMALYGRQKQLRRMGIYNDFCQKKSAVLLCTDVAARGLDIPAVDWVVQLDCPEDVNTYIHRVGRTARYKKDGNALLVLLPSEEEGMLEGLKERKIPIEQIRVNPKKMVSIQSKLQSFCAQSQEMKHWAQRSFICYLRSIHLQSNKRIFDVHKLPTDEYAKALGLATPPRIRFLQREIRRQEAGGVKGQQTGQRSDEESESDEEVGFDDDLEEEDILQVKRVIQPDDIQLTEEDITQPPSQPPAAAIVAPKSSRVTSKASLAKKLLNKKIKINSHIKFDEDGEQVDSEGGDSNQHDRQEQSSDSDTFPEATTTTNIAPVPIELFERQGEQGAASSVGGIDIQNAQELIRKRDRTDKSRERERVKASHREKRLKKSQRQFDQEQEENGGSVVLAHPVEMSDQDSDEMSDDMIMKERLSLEDSSDSEEESESQPPRAKRKKASPKKQKKERKKRSKHRQQLGTETASPELNEDEELALHLLAS